MRRILLLLVLAAALLPARAQPDLSHMRSLIEATPVGSWVNLTAGNTPWSTTWPTPRHGGDPGSVVYAWGSMVWDPSHGQFILWGGGHANYAGNEVYTLSGATGEWARASLPSAYQAGTSFIAGNGAPQSSHTYDNSQYLPISDRWVTFGGAAWNGGSNFSSAAGREGPWLWDPSKADPDKVGGQDGTGLVPGAIGSNAWESRRGHITGTLPPSLVEASTGYRAEGGKDVVYVTSDTGASGFPRLYRYEFNLAGNDVSQMVGVLGSGQYAYQGTGTVDTQRGWYARTIWPDTGSLDLAVWDLSRNNATTPSANPSFGVKLQRPDGSDFNVMPAVWVGSDASIEFDPNTGHYFLFVNASLTEIIPTANPDGTPGSVWTAIERVCVTGCPTSVGQDVLGHWVSVPELGVMALMAKYDQTVGAQDVDVWAYRVAEIPEPGTWLQLAAGLAVLGGVASRRRLMEG